MKNKFLLISLAALIGVPIGSYAAWDLTSETIDFQKGFIQEHLISGNYVISNEVVDGNTIQTNQFVADGATADPYVMGYPATNFINAQVQAGFPMATAITSVATRGSISSVGIYGYDKTVTNLGNGT